MHVAKCTATDESVLAACLLAYSDCTMSSPGWIAKCAGALVVVACGSVGGPPSGDSGGGGDDDVPPGDFTITTDPTSLTLPIAGSGTVTVTVQRTGAVGDIMLSASGLGANVSAAFSPNPIPASASTSQAAIAIAGGSAPATTSITVTGTAGATQHAATLSVTSTTISVTGTIRGNRSGVKVGIIGKQSVTSGAGGVFTFTDVIPPYDLYTFGSSGSTSNPTPTVFLFNHLTRPDPIVSAPTTSDISLIAFCLPIPPRTCPNSAVTGTRTGARTNTDDIVFAWTGPSGGSFSGAVLNADGTYSGTIRWNSGADNAGVLHALQFTRRPSGAPNTFIGYARSTPTTVSDGVAATINLAATSVNSTATLSGTITAPAGYPMPSISLVQQFGTTQAVLWNTNMTNTVDATFPLISAAGGTSLFASVASPAGTGSSAFVQPLTATVAVNFAMPAVAVLNTPEDAATGVTTSTHFTWTSSPSIINELNISTGGTNRASYRIFTMANDATIPVVPELTFPADQDFSWRVNGYGPNASIDEAAAANELETASSSDYQGPPHAFTNTTNRAFHSAP